MFRVGIIILLSLFLASCLGKAKHYRQYSDKGLSLAEAKSYCNSEGNVDRIAARDASAAAREAQRSSGPRNYDITGVRIGDQVYGTVRERPQASGGFATGALNSLNDNLQGMFAKRKAVRRCMMSLGYVETEAPSSYSTISSQTMRQAEEIRDQMERERQSPLAVSVVVSKAPSERETKRLIKGMNTNSASLAEKDYISGQSDRTVCAVAYDSTANAWESDVNSQDHIIEAKKRGLSTADCKYLSEKGSDENLDPFVRVCVNALDQSGRWIWPDSRNWVTLAKDSGYSEKDCQEVLRKAFTSTSSGSPQQKCTREYNAYTRSWYDKCS